MASDVAALVSEMNDTLADIRHTIDALSTKTHTSRLDQLEHQRDSTIAALRANFERETDDISIKRRRERDDIVERRRQEDEEIAARRQREDEDMGAREGRDDEERERRFVGETDDVEEEMDGLMEGVETEAEMSLVEGRDTLAQLEERRKELNRLIDEQVRVPFPTVTTRRRSRNQRTMDAAITSKPATAQATGEPLSNTLKAIKEGYDGGAVTQPTQQAGLGARAVQGDEDERGGFGSENASRGSFESSGARRSRTASVSSTQRGSRMSAFGWIAGKIGLREAREQDEAVMESEGVSKFEQDGAVQVVAEIPDHPPVPPGEMSVPDEASVMQEDPTLEKSTSDGGEKAAESTMREANFTHPDSFEIEVRNSELEPDTTLSTPAEDHGSKSSYAVGESQPVAITEHENRRASSDGPGDLEQSRHPSANAALAPQALDDAQDESEPSYNQYLKADVFRNEGESEEDIPRERSTSSSRAGSDAGTTTAPASSEATLEVDSEPYYENQVVQRAYDKDSNGGFEPELGAADDIPDEESDVGNRALGSSQPEDAARSPVEPAGSIAVDLSRETPVDAALSEESFPAGQPVQQDDTVSIGGDDYVEYSETYTSANNPPRTMSEGLPLEEMHAVPSEPLTPEPEGDAEIPNTDFYEEVHQTEETFLSPRTFTAETSASASDSGAGQPFGNPGSNDGSNVPKDLGEHLEVELAPHAIEYSSVVQSVQFPDGTWSAGVVDEEHYELLIAQYMVPSVIASERNIPEDVSPGPPISEDGDDGASGLGELSESVATPPGEHIPGHESAELVYASFSHDTHPAAIQLANGAWAIDPSDREFEDAPALLQGTGVSVPTEVRSPDADAPEDQEFHYPESLDLRSIVHDAQPVTMQLASGFWALDPSEAEYESAATHLRSTSPLPEPVTSMMDTPAYSVPRSNDDNPSEGFGSPPPTPVHHTFADKESSQEANASPQEQVSSAADSKISDGGGEMSLQEIDTRPVQQLPGNGDQQPTYGASQAAARDVRSLPWSPFNSRIPLSPDTSLVTATQSPQLDEAHEVERTENADTASTAERHLTFGYGRGSTGGEEDGHPDHDVPNNSLPHTDMLNVTEAATDNESQNFVTPLQSASIQPPPSFQDAPDAFHSAVDYPHSDSPREEAATTVHGQDELFDSDSASEYEPDPGVDENGDPRANLAMPPLHHALPQSEEAAGSPNTAILQPSGEGSLRNTPEMPPATEDNSDISPLSLREAAPPSPSRGLAFSRHNPARPVTPPSQTIPGDLGSHGGSWDASGPVDSTPMSLVSHSTLSSSPDSPVRERTLESREPVIQNGWAEDVHGIEGGRYVDHEFEGDYERTSPQDAKLEGNLPTPIATHMPESVRDHSPATPSPSTLIQRMRGIFENSSDASPVRSRPSSGIFNPPRQPESPGYDVPGEPRKGGFLNEAEDEVDERSALLGSVGRN